MSIRNNNSLTSFMDMAVSGTDLPGVTSAYTMMWWNYVTGLAGRAMCWGIRAADTTIRIGVGNLFNENANDFCLLNNDAYDVYTSSPITTGVWYHMAVSQGSATARTLYVDGGTSWILPSTSTASGVPDTWRLFADSNYHLNGRIGAIKIWTTNLSQAQIQAEMNFANPQLLTNFWGGWNLKTVADRNTFIDTGSGTPGTWTVSGAQLIDEADPPIAFDAATFDQAGHRWRDNDGTEATATWLAAQNANITRAPGVATRLRDLIDSADLDPGAEALQWEYRKKSSGQIWRKV